MATIKIITAASILIVLLATPVVSKESAVVFDFEEIGIDHQTALAAAQVFRNELEATGKFSVITKGDMEARLADAGIYDFTCYDVAGAAHNGNITGTDKAVIGPTVSQPNQLMIWT